MAKWSFCSSASPHRISKYNAKNWPTSYGEPQWEWLWWPNNEDEKKSNTGKNEQQQQQEWENECVNEKRMVDIEEMEGRGLVGREWKAKEYHERNKRNE